MIDLLSAFTPPPYLKIITYFILTQKIVIHKTPLEGRN